MASLLTNPKLGNTGVSSLVKSAQTIQNSITANSDAVTRINWENSGHTDAAFAEYSQYLNGRIKNLQGTGSITDSTKAINMGQELVTANHANISYQIQQENDALMMSGDAGTSSGYAQKMDVLASQYNRALGIGDQTLANSLQTQYLSLSQSYQSSLQSESDAANTLFKANTSAIKSGYSDAVGAIKTGVENLLANIKSPLENAQGKPADVKSQLSDYVKNNKATYDALGVKLPSGTNLTLGNLLEASFQAKYASDVTAAHALGGSPSDAAKFAKFDAQGNVVGGEALGVLNNTAYYNVPGLGNVNYRDAQNISADPNAIREVSKDGKTEFRYNTVVGYTMGANGQPMKVYSPQEAVPLDKQPNGNSQKVVQQLIKAGFGEVTYNKKDNTFTTKLTAQSDHWLTAHGMNPDLSSGTGKNSDQTGTGNTITWRINANGGLDSITSGNRLVHLAFDTNDKAGLFQTLPNRTTVPLTGQYGFNEKVNTLIGNATTDALRLKMANQALQAQTLKANSGVKGLTSGAAVPLPGSFMALHPGAGGGQPSHLIGPQAQMAQRAGGGFNFTQNGQAISAARYSQLTGTPFRTLLQNMANQGDAGAKSALGFVGNDYGYDPGKISGQANVYNALTWGVKPTAGGAPAPTQGVPSPSSPISIGGMHL